MNNRNTEENEERGGASGGGGWSSYVPMVAAAAAAVGLPTLYWMIRDIRQKNNELQMKIMRDQLCVKRQLTIHNFYITATIFDVLSSSSEEKKNHIIDTVFFNRLYLAKLSLWDEVEDLLVERQHIFCSRFKPRSQRLKLEVQIRNKVSESMPSEVPRFEEVFAKDGHCASCLTYLWTRDKRRNGRLMWELLDDLRGKAIQDLRKEKVKNILNLNEDSGQPSSSSGGS
ncbi:uncharacterized protein LOC115428212 [Sphaeramia orbicularis]|uniref:uncharacterized protein LOC115428212 n=1 Tax=Sphaeramia orbicularis TaxID=375764 RepID=UPI00117CDDE4|nr:uncharacterized protein LOC115428212 [Sphaeramia orbicularis]